MHPIERSWYRPNWITAALAPLTVLFVALAALRRAAYRSGWLPVQRLSAPVLVVGNITVGGAGKTPLTLALAQLLQQQGWRPGIISRGYGGAAEGCLAVTADADPAQVGDEPLLLARRSACPVYVGRDRAAAGRALLAAHPQTDILLCDDGLQHYRLGRDVEIAVVDAVRGLGNGWRLPAGPLREAPSRLATVDAVVLNGEGAVALTQPLQFRMQLRPGPCWQLVNPARQRSAAALAGQRLAALAGIGHPARFFAMLSAMGLHFSEHPFPDHHAYTSADLAAIDADVIVVTEKDAVKLAGCNDARIWALPVAAELPAGFADWLSQTLTACVHRRAANKGA